jgi:hypothetical protein
MMRKTLLLAAVAASHLLATQAMAAVTVSTFDLATYVEDHSDLFDVAQGAFNIASDSMFLNIRHSPATSDDPSAALGGLPSINVEPGTFLFGDGSGEASNWLTFKTRAPVAISGFNLYLLDSPDTGYRRFTDVRLLGSLDGMTFSSLGGTTLTGSSYTNGYGSRAIRVTSTFASATYQFFRFEGNRPVFSQFDGARIIELDAIAGVAVVPEPATYALMLLGLGIFGAAAKRRNRALR